jgi:hypothetical protein
MSLDIEAEHELGVTTENVTQDELDYLRGRRRELEAVESGEPLLVREVLICEYNIKRIHQRQQELNNAKASTKDELELTQASLKVLAKQLDEFMERYNVAMDRSGARVVRKAGVGKQVSPLPELWLRYRRAIAAKEKRGEKVGEPSKEALDLADKKAEETGLKSDYRIKGALPDDVRRKAIDDVQYPSVDEKKNLVSLGVMMDDFLHDPCLAAACIFAEVLAPEPDPPFAPVHELRLFGQWTHPFFIDSSGFGTGKTFCTALVCALRAVLMTDRHIGIVCDSFHQGKLYFTDCFDPWLKKCPIFSAQVEMSTKGGYHVIHNDDSHVMHFKDNSELKVLPPNFMNDAKSLKTESWTEVVGDEYTSWSNFSKSINIIQGRMRRPIGRGYDAKNPIFAQHQAFLGAADYTWRACYQMLQRFEARVRKGSLRDCVQAWNYLDFTPRWRQIQYGINEENIEVMRDQMTNDEYERVILAHWMNDSTGYYRASEIEACRG